MFKTTIEENTEKMEELFNSYKKMIEKYIELVAILREDNKSLTKERDAYRRLTKKAVRLLENIKNDPRNRP